MGEDWAAIQGEIAGAIADVGTPLILEKPATTGPTYPSDPTPRGTKPTFTIYAVPGRRMVRDAAGTLIGISRETLLVSADGVVPAKADRVQTQGVWREIESVERLWQGGVNLLYKLTLVA